MRKVDFRQIVEKCFATSETFAIYMHRLS